MITIGQVWALGLGLTASVLVPSLIFYYLVASTNPATRGQSLQVIQTAQVLWEPYLFIGVARTRIQMAGRYLETLIASAAYEAQTGRSAATHM
jgi:hypothetical protein